MTLEEEPVLDGGFDPAERALCQDEACIGVLGPDGRCKICGRQGALPAPSAGATSADAPAEPAPPLPDDEAAPAASQEEGEEFQARRLCPDGACVGLIGPDGRCKLCGLPETGTAGGLRGEAIEVK